jgi:Fe(3+) dicitrate transport protein
MKLMGLLMLVMFTSYDGFTQNKGVENDSSKIIPMPQIQVLLQRDRLLSKVPGSVFILDSKTIKKISPTTSNELLRKVTGLHVVDEEGAGLRLNIGVRGLDPDRSRNILILEDGIPVALNPYGEPEMYFSPQIDKVSTVEVLKGSGQILFGPQTTGGVINLITQQPPEKETKTLRIKIGTGGFLSTFWSYGNAVGKTSFIVNYLNKRADNIGSTRFNLHDFSGKLKIELNKRVNIGIKIGVYDEASNSTYIGITQAMYNKGGQDFSRLAPNDFLPIKRYSISGTHQYKINNNMQLQTSVFSYTTTRNWRRQDFSSNATTSNQTGVIWGDESIPGGAIYMLKSNGHRNRQFEVSGIESQLKWKTNTQFIQIGTRLLHENADEQYLIGNKPNANGGNLRDVEFRKGKALSVYVHDKISITKKLEINIGTRIEKFDYSRNIQRGRLNIGGSTEIVDTNLIASNNLVAVIPGIGFNFNQGDETTFFGGIHRGFSPPRTKDAITTEGIALDIKQEDSWNTEIGMRKIIGEFFKSELTFFSLDFINQIIPVSQSSGNTNAIGLANGGKTTHRGIEAGFDLDLGKALNKKISFIVSSNITLIDSRYAANRYIKYAGNIVNIKNNKLPYASSIMMNNGIEFESKNKHGFRLSGNYVGKQFADELNTANPSGDGRIGLIPPRYITDATFFTKHPTKNITATLSIKNITNERYIASRRPQGIRVGIDRQIIAGVEVIW